METVRPESVGMSSEQLAHVDRHLQENYVDSGKIPGCQTLVFRRGGLAHHSVLGRPTSSVVPQQRMTRSIASTR